MRLINEAIVKGKKTSSVKRKQNFLTRNHAKFCHEKAVKSNDLGDKSEGVNHFRYLKRSPICNRICSELSAKLSVN